MPEDSMARRIGTSKEDSTARRIGTSKERSRCRWGDWVRPTTWERDRVFPTAERFSPPTCICPFLPQSTGRDLPVGDFSPEEWMSTGREPARSSKGHEYHRR